MELKGELVLGRWTNVQIWRCGLGLFLISHVKGACRKHHGTCLMSVC